MTTAPFTAWGPTKLFTAAFNVAAALALSASPLGAAPAHAAAKLPSGCTTGDTRAGTADVTYMYCRNGLAAGTDLRGYRSLRTLEVDAGRATALPLLPSGLQSLYVNATGMTDFSGLSRTPNLTSLKIHSGRVSNLAGLARSVKKLESLELQGNYWGRDLSALAGLASLKTLTVKAADATKTFTAGQWSDARFTKGLDGKYILPENPTVTDAQGRQVPRYEFNAATGKARYATGGYAVERASSSVSPRPGLRVILDLPRDLSVRKVSAWALEPSLKMKVTGVKGVGGTLTVEHPHADTFQWLRDGKKIEGATKASYTLTAADTGRRIKVRGTDSHELSANAAPVAIARYSQTLDVIRSVPVQFEKTAVTVTGTQAPGAVLTAQATSTPAATTISYQWHLDGKPIKGATKTTYRVAEGDGAGKITVTAKARRDGYLTAAATGNAAISAAQKNITAPTMRFSLANWVFVDGDTPFRAQPGTWELAPDSYHYQWYMDGKPVKGATRDYFNPRLKIGAEALIQVKVSAVRLGTAAKSAMSTVYKAERDTNGSVSVSWVGKG